jgi:hypothetical protein
MTSKLYCVKCKKKQKCDDLHYDYDRNGRVRLEGFCERCGTATFQYVSADKSPVKKSVKRR